MALSFRGRCETRVCLGSGVSMFVCYRVEVMFLIKLGLNGLSKRSKVRFLNNLKDLVQNSH